MASCIEEDCFGYKAFDWMMDVAKVCHAANNALRMAFGQEPGVAWDAASDEIKQSARQGVETLYFNPHLTPENVHGRWCDAKTAAGWVYGPVKDEQAKTHPCLVPYDQLPVEERAKDHVFRAIALTLSGSPA